MLRKMSYFTNKLHPKMPSTGSSHNCQTNQYRESLLPLLVKFTQPKNMRVLQCTQGGETGQSLKAVTCNTCYRWVCLILLLMLRVKLSVVDRIQPQSNKFATSVENQATGDSKLNDSLER